jgi:hypothetical protein
MQLEVCAGLANRLRATASGLCAAEDISQNLILSWPHERVFDAIWADLFEPIPSVEHMVTSLEKPTLCLSPRDWDAEKGNPIIKIKSYGHFHQSDPVRWLIHLRKIVPLPVFRQTVDILLGTTRPIGVHIRRTDHAKAIQNSPTKAFIHAMRAYPEDTIFFLATDDIKEWYTLAAHFPGRILHYSVHLNRNSLDGIQEALVDFLALSRCREILGSVGSSFSEMAAAYGDVPLKIIQAQ